MTAGLVLEPVGQNAARLWGLSSAERLRRIGVVQGFGAEGEPVLVNLRYVFDPAWLRFIGTKPNHVVTRDGVPVLARASDPALRAKIRESMERSDAMPPGAGIETTAQEQVGGLVNKELRKREQPFMERLTADTAPALERISYSASYKGVTDLLTKYLWPEWALWLTRVAARLGISPNMVTSVGAILCIAATFAFYYGHYWSGLAMGLAFMVLDTVDGKLARCTITSSWWGNIFDHGIDLVHPPFWWFAWGAGLQAYGRPLDQSIFWTAIAAIVGGYVVQRLIEGAFIRMYKIHIHVWERIDSQFRLITARRNPNMVILFASLLVGRPDAGLVAVAAWTVLSCLFHAVRLVQAMQRQRRGGPVLSWLE